MVGIKSCHFLSSIPSVLRFILPLFLPYFELSTLIISFYLHYGLISHISLFYFFKLLLCILQYALLTYHSLPSHNSIPLFAQHRTLTTVYFYFFLPIICTTVIYFAFTLVINPTIFYYSFCYKVSFIF